MPCQITSKLNDGRTVTKKVVDYEGFHTRPVTYTSVAEKVGFLAPRFIEAEKRKRIIDAAARLDGRKILQLTQELM
jgi:2-methylcitrate dehydratase